MRQLIILTLSLGALAVPGFSAIQLDFGGQGHGTGSISGTDCASPCTVTGTSILIDTLIATGTTLNAGTTSITGGALSFSGTGGSFSSGTYTYTGGTFTIAGTDSGAGAFSVSGTITKLTVDMTGQITLITGPNNIGSTLATYFGEPSTGWGLLSGSVHFDTISGGGGGAYSASTFSTDLPDFLTPVPEPTSILLLGSSMLALARLSRRRKKA